MTMYTNRDNPESDVGVYSVCVKDEKLLVYLRQTLCFQGGRTYFIRINDSGLVHVNDLFYLESFSLLFLLKGLYKGMVLQSKLKTFI